MYAFGDWIEPAQELVEWQALARKKRFVNRVLDHK